MHGAQAARSRNGVPVFLFVRPDQQQSGHCRVVRHFPTHTDKRKTCRSLVYTQPGDGIGRDAFLQVTHGGRRTGTALRGGDAVETIHAPSPVGGVQYLHQPVQVVYVKARTLARVFGKPRVPCR